MKVTTEFFHKYPQGNFVYYWKTLISKYSNIKQYIHTKLVKCREYKQPLMPILEKSEYGKYFI